MGASRAKFMGESARVLVWRGGDRACRRLAKTSREKVSMSETLVATAAFGLEAIVVRELTALGYDETAVEAGRVRFKGDLSAICRANLWLRTSDRVLIEVGHFKARDFGELFDCTTALAWERWLPADARFPVVGKSIRSQLSSVPACQRIVKKAVVERLRRGHGVSDLPEDGPEYRIEVSLLDDEVSLTLDTSGVGLHKRGYRQRSGPAPLKETLAAALVMLSYWRPDRPLLDPFCGSGTIPIEAALIGLNRAPGLHRNFISESWPALPPALWQEARKEAQEAVRSDVSLSLLGSDCDPAAIELSREHAALAGVGEHICWEERDFLDVSSSRDYGCVITNPPYGERLGEQRLVEQLYQAMPGVLGRFSTWSHYVLLSQADFEAIIGRRADRRRKLYNGRIACTYFQFHGPRPPQTRSSGEQEEEREGTAGDNSQVESQRDVVEWQPAFGGVPEGAEEQAATFQRRLEKRSRHFRRWPTKQGITCFRIYDRDVPGVPLVVDRYEDCLHVTEYERRDAHVAGQHETWLELMTDTLSGTLGVPRDKVYLKGRRRQLGKTQHERVDTARQTMVAHEGGLEFEVNLSDYIDTGLFLDHRQTRAMVRKIANGKDLLNLFCYTGSFSVYAAAGGARSTCSVDLSSTYLEWARRNLRRNGITDDLQHRLEKADVFTFLRSSQELFDVVIVDPPTFSNSKSTDTVFDVQRNHRELLELSLARLRPGGACLFSTNRRRFKFEADDLEGVSNIREITNQTLPPDFQIHGAHRCWRLVRQEGDDTIA